MSPYGCAGAGRKRKLNWRSRALPGALSSPGESVSSSQHAADDRWGVAIDGERHINKASARFDVGGISLNRRRLDAVNACWRSGDSRSSGCLQPEDNVGNRSSHA